MMSRIPDNIEIAVMGRDGTVRIVQTYSDYLRNPNITMQCAIYGKSLVDILIEESYISSDLELKQILTNDPYADATRLIGNIAEALVVKYCNEFPDVNRTLARYARFGQRETKTLDNYMAIGTGLNKIKNMFPQHYQPNDTQRDIIWIDKKDNSKQLACIGSTSNSTKTAGLQVKASHDGVRYVLPNITDYFYPILYFDLNDDWGLLKKALIERRINARLIHPDEIMREIKEHLKGYFKIVIALINNEITVQELIRKSQYEGDSVLLSGIETSDINCSKSIIIPA
jgi:hypothetical protein